MSSIHDVVITPLRKIPDERGAVLHMLREDSDVYERFGEIYFSLVHPGAIKAWHLHREMTLNYAVPTGMVKLVCYDDRPESPTNGVIQEVFLGDLQYVLVTIPPRVWNGFKGVGNRPALVANCATVPHSPDEIVRRDPFDSDISYDWTIRHG